MQPEGAYHSPALPVRVHFPVLLIVLLGILFTFSCMHVRGQVIRLMSYNIRYDTGLEDPESWSERKEFLGGQLLFHGPDILGIQEGLHHQVLHLDSLLFNHTYVGVGRDDGREAGEYSAIFIDTTKFRWVRQSSFWLSETPDRPSVGWDASMERICTYALLESRSGGQRFWVFNTHFDHVGIEARKNSASLIVQEIQELNTGNHPVVLMGDFNLEPDDETIIWLNSIFQDTKATAGIVSHGPEGTYNAFRFNEPVRRRIDYIFTSRPGIRVRKFAILSESSECHYPSDHFPVVAEIELGAD